MKKRIRYARYWLLSLVSRLSIIALAVMVLCGVFFILGGIQKFTESTQLFLLNAVRILSFYLSILMVFNIIVIIYHTIAGNRFKFGRIIIVLFGLVFCVSLYALSIFVTSMLSAFG